MAAGGKAIIARMGIDLNGLRGDLSQAEKIAVRAANNMQSALNKATKGGHRGGGGGGNRYVGDAINAATGTSGAVNEIGMLTHTLGFSAKLAGGALVAYKTLEKMAEAMIKVEEANEGLKHSLGQKSKPWWEHLGIVPEAFKKGDQVGAAAVFGVEGMQKRRDELAAASEKAQKSRGFWSSIGGAVMSGGVESGNPIYKSIKLQQQADEERLKLDAKIAGIVRDEVAARKILVHQSREEGELALLELQTREKINALRDDPKLGVAERKARVDAVRAEAAHEAEAIRLKAAAAEREAGVQTRLNYIRIQGDDESVKAAYARVDAAKEEVDAARNAEEERAARAKLDTAETEYHFAQKTRDEKRRSQASEIEIAELRTSADLKHMATLIAEERLIQARQRDARTTADQQRELAVDAARNAAAQRGHAFAMGNTAFDIGGSQIGASQGVGQREAMRVARERLQVERSRLTFFQNSPEAGVEAVEKQREKVNGMARSYADAAYALARGHRTAKAQTEEMAMQLAHQDTLAAAVATQLDYAENIRDAQRDGNTELAAQLGKQKELAAQTAVRNQREAQQEERGYTLGELAAHRGGSASTRARRIQRLEERGHRLRASGRIAESDALYNRAAGMRRSLADRGILKPGEANRDFAKEMDNTTFAKNIQRIADNLGVNIQ